MSTTLFPIQVFFPPFHFFAVDLFSPIMKKVEVALCSLISNISLFLYVKIRKHIHLASMQIAL